MHRPDDALHRLLGIRRQLAPLRRQRRRRALQLCQAGKEGARVGHRRQLRLQGGRGALLGGDCGVHPWQQDLQLAGLQEKKALC